MARAMYRVTAGQTFYDGVQLQEAGAQVPYDHDPGENLVPLNAEAKAAWKRVNGSDYKPGKPAPEAEADPADQG